MSFAHLHVHSEYSLLDGLAKVRELFHRAEELCQPGLALTDHGFMYGVPDFLRTAEEFPSIKPVVGCEVYLNDEESQRYYHLILLAKNLEGYHNLCQISTIAATQGMCKGKPRVSHDVIKKYSAGLIATSACIGGEIPHAILSGDDAKVKDSIAWYKETFGDDFYLEVSLHKSTKKDYDNNLFEIQTQVNTSIFALAKEYGINVIASNDVHFVNASDADAHDALLYDNTRKFIVNSSKCLQYTGQEYLKSEQEMLTLFSDHPEVISNTIDLLDKVERYSIWSAPKYPKVDVVTIFDEAASFNKLANPVYKERFDYEMSVIRRKQAEPYYVMIKGLVDAVRKHGGIVGPGRGTAAGSIVNYVLGITTIDPVEFGLVSEHAIDTKANPEASPDIDLDFNSEGYEMAYNYLTDTFGKDCVSRTLQFGRKPIGTVRGPFIHSSAVLVSNCSLSEKVPMCLVKDERSGKVYTVPQYSKADMERIGVISIDILRLDVLDELRIARREIGFQDEISIDDKEALKVFARGWTKDIFMFSSLGVRKWLRQMDHPKYFDLVALLSMYRPGQMEHIPTFVARQTGKSKVAYPISNSAEVLSETYGMIIYQEQLMKLVELVAGFSRDEAKDLQKAVYKHDIGQLDRQHQQFISRGMAKGYDEDALEQFWNNEVISENARLLFNKSHAACATWLALQCAGLKARDRKAYQGALRTVKDEKTMVNLEDIPELGGKLLGLVNLDLRDWHGGNKAHVAKGFGRGDERVKEAIQMLLKSLRNARSQTNALLCIAIGKSGQELSMGELKFIDEVCSSYFSDYHTFKRGIYQDPSLDEDLRLTLIYS